MSVRAVESVQQYLRRLCEEAVPTDDGALLDRFATANDCEAFERLLARHGPMVLGTARRLVGNSHDAEDVFQAVFLSLARQARSIRQGVALPAWLYQVTCRIAIRVRANRLMPTEPPPERSEHNDPVAGLVWREVCEALDEELQRLPERLRSPLLLCYLCGLTRDEAAGQLGWSLGTLKRRLEEGRNALRVRLARRGIAPAGLALAVLAPGALRAAVSRALLDTSLRLIATSDAVIPATVSALVIGSTSPLKGVAMKSILVLLAFVALGVAAYVSAGPGSPSRSGEGNKEIAMPTAQDEVAREDDPLPARSILRFGTSRFRHGMTISSMVVSADGALAVAVNGNGCPGATRAFDLVSGRSLFPIGEGGYIEAAAISPDGQSIVTKQDFSLRIRDATGKELRKIALQRANEYSSNEWVAFSPNGKTLAVTSQGRVIHLIDFESGKTIRDITNDNPDSRGWDSVLGIAFSADGKLMASGGFTTDKGIYFARLWDVETGKEIRRFLHSKYSYGIPSLAISPDGKSLATRSHDGRLRLFELATGKEQHTFPKDGGGRKLGAVAFSPDSRTVVAAGDSVRFYEVTTGKERLRIDRQQASHLQFTDAGKTLTGAVDGAIYRWDTTSGKMLTPDAGDSAVEQVLVSADGTRVVTRGQCADAHIWDGATARHLRRFTIGWQYPMAISPDGRYLAWPVDDSGITFMDPQEPQSRLSGTRIWLYDIAADKTQDRIPAVEGVAQDLAFTDDGKRVVTVESYGGMVRIWNLETGKEERSFQAMPKSAKEQQYRVGRVLISPDGKTVVKVYQKDLGGALGGDAPPPQFVHAWDVATGKELPSWSDDSPVDGAFSPDGRFVVTRSGIGIREVATGARVATLSVNSDIQSAAFSRDGRHLATADSKGIIHIWEVATWTRRNDFPAERSRPTALTFAPNGELLSGCQDTTVLVWPMRPPRVAETVTLERAWDDLAGRDASESFRSEGWFLASPSDAVACFATRIEIAPTLDPKRVERLLAELDSDDFAVREAAEKALAGFDDQVTPHLEEAQKAATSVEVRSRVTRILTQRRQAALSPALIRQIRAVMVLERIGNAEAKALLKRWAGGPKGARLTGEANAALKRLARPETSLDNPTPAQRRG